MYDVFWGHLQTSTSWRGREKPNASKTQEHKTHTCNKQQLGRYDVPCRFDNKAFGRFAMLRFQGTQRLIELVWLFIIRLSLSNKKTPIIPLFNSGTAATNLMTHFTLVSWGANLKLRHKQNMLRWNESAVRASDTSLISPPNAPLIWDIHLIFYQWDIVIKKKEHSTTDIDRTCTKARIRS